MKIGAVLPQIAPLPHETNRLVESCEVSHGASDTQAKRSRAWATLAPTCGRPARDETGLRKIWLSAAVSTQVRSVAWSQANVTPRFRPWRNLPQPWTSRRVSFSNSRSRARKALKAPPAGFEPATVGLEVRPGGVWQVEPGLITRSAPGSSAQFSGVGDAIRDQVVTRQDERPSRRADPA